MTLRLNGSTSGFVEIDAPAAAGSNTLVLPTGNGTSGQYLQTNGSGALSWATIGSWTEATAASTSGSTVEFTGLPADTKEVAVVWSGVSGASAATLEFRLGTGATPTYATTGYSNLEIYYGASSASVTTTTDRFRFSSITNTATHLYNGQVIFRNPTGDVWVTEGVTWSTSYGNAKVDYGSIDLGAELTAIQFYWSTGDFDAGNWKIMYRR